MVKEGERICPQCGGCLSVYDHVLRIIRTKGGDSSFVKICRYRCKYCKRLHRAMPSYILPYKQYETEVVRGVIEGLITCETLGYEDHPCEMTMIRWRAQNIRI